MGLASSQARLLLLTARKSDLEYRAQMISQRKIMLAMETEGLATDYTRALSNREMRFVFDNDSSNGQTITSALTYHEVTAKNADLIGNFIVTDASGKMMVPSAGSLPSGFVPEMVGDKQFAVYKGKDGATKQSFELNICPDITNKSMFQNALRSGGAYLQKLNVDTEKYENKSWQGLDVIQDQLDKDDDPIAQSNYETKSLTIQNQDKMLDLELKQIETQHKAVETEYDGVKKVIDKNIEVSYKIFANG